MKVVTVVGARPQFIKAAPLSRQLRKFCSEVFVHTGQHYDDSMSAVFFRELGLPEPDINLGVRKSNHGAQTAAMLVGIEQVLLETGPDWVLVYGDTNSTLAGVLAASKLRIPVAHMEAGLRSFNRSMPEEINRLVADRLAALLFCPSHSARLNLQREGIAQGVYVVGDVMMDALMEGVERAIQGSDALARLQVSEGAYLLATLHRAGNVDNPRRLAGILKAFEALDEDLVFPVHPRTREAIKNLGWKPRGAHLHLIEPVSYLDMLRLESGARLILTDSGGVQKEAYWLKVPCVTLREETEWVETIESGWNLLAGADTHRILKAVAEYRTPDSHPPLYGDGHTAQRCVKLLLGEFQETGFEA